MINFKNNNLLKNELSLYEDFLIKQGKKHTVVLGYLNPNKQFIEFLSKADVSKPSQITKDHILGFQMYLYDKKDFTQNSVATFIKHIKLFLNYLIKNNKLDVNVAKDIEILKKPTLPEKQLSHFYTYDEILCRYLGNQKQWVSYSYMNNVRKHIKGFIKYLLTNDIGSFYSVTEGTILNYRNYLFDELINFSNGALVIRSQVERLRNVVKLFKYLNKQGILKRNPTDNLGWEKYYKNIYKKAKEIKPKPETKQVLTEFSKLKLTFLEYQLTIGKSKNTIKKYRKSLEIFFAFLGEQGIDNVAQINKRILLEYYSYICHYVGVKGNLASNCYKNQMIWTIKIFFRFLVRYDYLTNDVSVELQSVKEEKGLPRVCMTDQEVMKLINMPDVKTPLGLRDKAILELLYSSGIRSNELRSINIDDIDLSYGAVRINCPKGGMNYQRIVPIGQSAIDIINCYLINSRAVLDNCSTKALFLSYKGQRLNNDSILNIVKKYVFKCGFRKNITTHSFRVSCATSMLRNGADIRYVQEQLGHKRITSTQIYTRLNCTDLKRIHKLFHPRERNL